MDLWIGIKGLNEADCIKLLADYCKEHDAVDDPFVIESYAISDWVLLKVYFSEMCYDSIYPQEFAESAEAVDELFISRSFGGSASSQVLEIFKNGVLKLQLDLINRESKFAVPFDELKATHGDFDALIDRDNQKDNEERSELQSVLAKLYPELNQINEKSIFGIFDGLCNVKKTFYICQPDGNCEKSDEYLEGYEPHEIEYEGDTLYLWGG